jgi:hypothetical protein
MDAKVDAKERFLDLTAIKTFTDKPLPGAGLGASVG